MTLKLASEQGLSTFIFWCHGIDYLTEVFGWMHSFLLIFNKRYFDNIPPKIWGAYKVKQMWNYSISLWKNYISLDFSRKTQNLKKPKKNKTFFDILVDNYFIPYKGKNTCFSVFHFRVLLKKSISENVFIFIDTLYTYTL